MNEILYKNGGYVEQKWHFIIKNIIRGTNSFAHKLVSFFPPKDIKDLIFFEKYK